MLPKEENHIPKTVLKEIQKERVENAMKSGGQRVAIDFTVTDDMRNKVSISSIPLTDWLMDWLTDWLTDWRPDWPIGWLIDWLSAWLMLDYCIIIYNIQVNNWSYAFRLA